MSSLSHLRFLAEDEQQDLFAKAPSTRQVKGTGIKGEKRPREQALKDAELVREHLVALGMNKDDVYFCGSLRRGKAEVGDLDIVLCDEKVGQEFYERLHKKLADGGHEVDSKKKGPVLASFKIDNFLVEFKKTVPEKLGAMLLMATGNSEFNIGMRAYCKKHGLQLSENGLRKPDGPTIASRTEEEIFAALGLDFVEPKDRNGFHITSPRDTEHITHGKSSRPVWDGKRDAAPPKSPEIPQSVKDKLPPEILKKALEFSLPSHDLKGVPIPVNFLYSKTARQAFYRNRGKFDIPDDLKLDRYSEKSERLQKLKNLTEANKL